MRRSHTSMYVTGVKIKARQKKLKPLTLFVFMAALVYVIGFFFYVGMKLAEFLV